MDRRSFIAYTGKASLAAGFIGTVHSATTPEGSPTSRLPDPVKLPLQTNDNAEAMPAVQPEDERIGIAIVGLGRLSLEELLPAFGESKRTKITGLVSGNRDKALRVAKMYDVPEDSIYDYKNFDNIKNNPNIHAVYIVLPNSMHAEFTIRAARAKKHILCEKPMAMNVKECEEMIKASEENNVKLMIAYRVQYYPHHLKAKKMIEQGNLGKIKLLELQNTQVQSEKNPGQWRHVMKLAGGGALVNVGIYCLNAARFLTGEEPQEVYAWESTDRSDPRFKETDESISWMMKFPSGIIAQCTTSHGAAGSQRYTVIGTEAVLDMNPAFAYEGVKLKIKKQDTELNSTVISEVNLHSSNQFSRELDHIAECITKNKRPYTPGEEGLQDHRVMAAIYESIKSGLPVKLETFKKKDPFRGTYPSI